MKPKHERKVISETALARRNRLFRFVNSVLLGLSVLNFTVIIYDFGFDHTQQVKVALESFYSASLITGFVCLSIRLLLLRGQEVTRGARFAEYAVYAFQIAVILSRFVFRGWLAESVPYVRSLFFIYLLFIVVFFIELSKISLAFYRVKFSPALLYLGSFVLMIAFGTGLLLLPNATVNGITFIDALFTSTSAVCVTGLIVVDTATHFTTSGKMIILLLIQVGGLGVMTLTSFLGFFFQGAYSYQSQIFIKDFVNEDKIGQIFRTLFKIIFVTLAIEAVGALFIYFTLEARLFVDTIDRVQFSVFHAVSAFCNAGFSTLTDGLYDPLLRDRYNFQLVIIVLIILGGIGFPVLFNLWQYYRNILSVERKKILHIKSDVQVVNLNVNTKVILVTTAALLVVGTVLFFISEQGGALEGRTAYGKLVTAFFGSVTPRTAGFNTFDMTTLATPTILFYLLYMWIGASPGSTGGGIKTTTFALGLLNTISIAKSKNRLEMFRREIPSESVRRAFAVMLLSFLVIGMAVFLVSLFNPDKGLIYIAFECFSAYATVGLSLGFTGDLSTASKVVIIVTMYLGRVGTLTLIVGLLRRVKNTSYRYPTENVFIS